MAANSIEVRIAHLEGAYEQIDKRLDSIDSDIRDLRGEIRTLVGRMDRQFFWLLGLLIVSILGPVALRLTGHPL